MSPPNWTRVCGGSESWDRIIPNSIARSRVEKKVFVGDEIDNCRDLSGLAYRRPFEKVSP